MKQYEVKEEQGLRKKEQTYIKKKRSQCLSEKEKTRTTPKRKNKVERKKRKIRLHVLSAPRIRLGRPTRNADFVL